MRLCICGSKKAFALCCEPFLKGDQVAKSPIQLLRSRYAAYALGGNSQYLIKTWHPSTALNVPAADLDSSSYAWLSLKLIQHRQKGDISEVEFEALYSDKETKLKALHHKISIFKREKGHWFYLEGTVFA